MQSKLSNHLQIRMNDHYAKMLEKLAKRAGFRKSVYARRLLYKGLSNKLLEIKLHRENEQRRAKETQKNKSKLESKMTLVPNSDQKLADTMGRTIYVPVQTKIGTLLKRIVPKNKEND